MTSRRKYTLTDFIQYATGKLAAEYAAIADLDTYKFSDKSYLDERNKPCRRLMLLVGHYWRKNGGPPVWAHATGTQIRYYSGEGVQVNPLILDNYGFRVYYDDPFNAMSGIHNSSNSKSRMIPERRLERALVESVINFIFLAKGQLVHALDLESPDMLGSFRLACRNFAQHRKMPKILGGSLDEQLLEIEAENATIQEQIQYAGQNGRNDGLGLWDKEPTSTVPAKRSLTDLADSTSDVSSQNSNRRTVLLRHSSSCRTETYAELELEVQALRAKLQEQEAKNDATKAELARKKAKKRELRTQREEWKEKYINQPALAETVADSVKQEEEDEDWKAMLFEQEKKTEHYKLKYIALKEEKEQWKVREAEQDKKIKEHEAQSISRGANLMRESGESDHSERHPEPVRNSENNIEDERKRVEKNTKRKLERLELNCRGYPQVRGVKKLRRCLRRYVGREEGKSTKQLWMPIVEMVNKEFWKLLHGAHDMGHDVRRQKVMTRVYIEAVRHIDERMSKSDVV
ncbi:unnamed protein product [Alternaria alternata]